MVDLRGATFLDSAILSVLLDASRRSREAGLELPVVLNGNRSASRLVKATMVALAFDDLADATAAAGLPGARSRLTRTAVTPAPRRAAAAAARRRIDEEPLAAARRDQRQHARRHVTLDDEAVGT